MTDQARIAAIVDTQLSQRLRGGANYANRYAPKMAVFHEAADEIDFLIATLRKHIAVSQVAQVISDKFIVDEAQGYSSRDRQYVIEMLKPYLADACKAALSDAPSVRARPCNADALDEALRRAASWGKTNISDKG